MLANREVDPVKRNRFVLAPDDSEGPRDERVGRNRISAAGAGGGRNMFAELRDSRFFWPAVASLGIVAAIAATVLVVTTVVQRRGAPDSGQSAELRRDGRDTVYTDGEKKVLPEEKTDNPGIARGRESYLRGYLADAISEFTAVVESGASERDKAIALTYIGIIHDDRGEFDKAIEMYNRALRYDKRNPIIYRNLALAYRHKKEFEKAEEAIRAGLSISPDNVDNKILQGNILFEQGKFREARDMYDSVLKTDAGKPQALYNMGITLLKLGDLVSAMEYLKRAGNADRIGEVAHLAYAKLGVLYSQQRDLPEAEKYLRLAVAINPRDAVDRYNLGVVLLQQQKSQEALEEFQKAEDLGKSDASVLENIGEAYSSLKQYERGIAAFERLYAINRRNVRVLSRIAELYYEKGDLESAYEAYRRITQIEPATENARVAYLNMGNILDDAARHSEAVDAYLKALTINPKDDAALYNLGIAYKHMNKPELAIETWRKAADLNPSNPAPLLALADYYYETGHMEHAMDEFQKILRRFPGQQEGHFTLGTIYHKKGQNEYALEQFKRVIEINDKNELAQKAYINIGVLTSRSATDEKGLEQGLNYVQRALLLKPGDPEALVSMGTVYFKKEMYDKAIDSFYMAIKSSRDGKLIAEAYGNIGKSYHKKGQYQKALQAYTRAVEEDPTNEEVRMNRKAAMQAYERDLAR